MRDSDLEQAGARFKAAQVERDAARAALEPVVVQAIREGASQARVVELTGLTRETVRTIARRAGIGPGRQAEGRTAEPFEDAP